MLRKHNIQSWLKDNPSWNTPQDKPAQMLFIPSGAALVLDLQTASAATHSMSPDGRMAQHRTWGSTLVTASNGTKQVKLGDLSHDFEEILHATDLKSNQAQMYAESLSDFLEEVPSSTRDFLFKLTFPPHIGSLFCNLLLKMCLKKTLLLEDRAFLDKE
eukprot:4988751-Ditylum_brightwellii.AAC.1